jgi:hypothetical protein
MMNRSLVKYAPRRRTTRSLATFDDARLCYSGIPYVPGCRQHFEHRQLLEKIRQRMLARHRESFGS